MVLLKLSLTHSAHRKGKQDAEVNVAIDAIEEGVLDEAVNEDEAVAVEPVTDSDHASLEDKPALKTVEST